MIFFNNANEIVVVVVDFAGEYISVQTAAGKRIDSYCLSSFMDGDVTVSQISRHHNLALRHYIALVKAELANNKFLYQIEKPSYVGYSDAVKQYVDNGFELALNRVYGLVKDKACKAAYEYIKTNFKDIGAN